ncbi:MAG TPA: thiamine phosphate synthase [Vicinamibacterales bacterium]
MRLCLVTNRGRLARRLGLTPDAALDAIAALAGDAARAGVDLIQVREPGLEARELAQLVRAVIAAARPAGARIVVNDRLDVAMACGADGVHLKASSMPARAVRRLAPSPFLVGQSVHDPREVREAVEGGVDYLIFGTVFPSASKGPDWPLAGVAGLGEAVRAAAPVPVLAIGGVTPETAPLAAAAGAAGAAVIDALLPERIPAGPALSGRVDALRRAFDRPSGVS